MDNIYCKRVIGTNDIYEMIPNSTIKYVIKDLNSWNMTHIYTNCEKFDEVIFNFIKCLPYNDYNDNHHIQMSCNSYVSPYTDIWFNYIWLTPYQLKRLLKLIENTAHELGYCQKGK